METNVLKERLAFVHDLEMPLVGERAVRALRRESNDGLQVAAMNWGMAQTPPLFNRSPFHRLRPLEQEGGDRSRPPAHQGRGETAARYRAAEDEQTGASERRLASA